MVTMMVSRSFVSFLPMILVGGLYLASSSVKAECDAGFVPFYKKCCVHHFRDWMICKNITSGTLKGMTCPVPRSPDRSKLIIVDSDLPFLSPLDVPLSLYMQNVEVLSSKVRNISVDVVDRFPDIRNLYLRHNNLESLAFVNSFVALRSLHVSHEKSLRTINYLDFLNMTKLSELKLTDNAIETIGSTTYRLHTLMSLDLSGNLIDTLEPNIFAGLPWLNSLNLGNNKIDNLRKGVFTGLKTLTDLDLRNNPLKTVAEVDFVKELPALSELILLECELVEFTSQLSDRAYSLDVRNNRLKKIRVTHPKLSSLYAQNNSLNLSSPSDTFLDAPNLQILKLSSNRGQPSDDFFLKLGGLRELSLSENRITKVPADTFSKLSYLQQLDLSNSKLVELEANCFRGLDNLYALTLKGNMLETIDNGTFLGLSSLNSLTLSGRDLDLQKSFLFGLFSVTSLSLEDGSFGTVDNDAFLGMPNLQFMELSNVTIRRLAVSAFLDIPGLFHVGSVNANYFVRLKIQLNLSKLGVREIIPSESRELAIDMKEATSIDLSGNNITVLPRSFLVAVKNLKQITIVNSQVVDLSPQCFKALSFDKCQYEPQVVECFTNNSILLSSNLIKKLRPKTFSEIRNISVIDLRDNLIEEIEPGAFDDVSMYYNENVSLSRMNALLMTKNKLRTLGKGALSDILHLHTFEAGENELISIEPGAFPPSLVRLNLGYNALKVIATGTFDELGDLEVLVLSDNALASLNDHPFAKLRALKTLDLSSNRLENLPVGVFQSLRLLETLLLGGNRLSHFKRGAFSNLNNLLRLDLSDNLFANIEYDALYPLRRLNRLDLYNERLGHVNYRSLLSHLKAIKSVSLNVHDWSCQHLMSMLEVLDERGIEWSFPHADHDYDAVNVDGVPCRENESKHEKVVEEEQHYDAMIKHLISLSEKQRDIAIYVSCGFGLLVLCTFAFLIYKLRRPTKPSLSSNRSISEIELTTA